MLFPELKNASAWKQSGTSVLSREVTARYVPDGWLMDGDLHYHISGIEDFRVSLEVAQRNGEESRFPENYVESMRKMTDVVMNMSTIPTIRLGPNMADTRRATWTERVLQRNLTNYYDLFPDNQQMLWMATGGAEGHDARNPGHDLPRRRLLRDALGLDDLRYDDGAAKHPRRSLRAMAPAARTDNTFELWVKGTGTISSPTRAAPPTEATSSSNADRRKYAASTADNTVTLGDADAEATASLLEEFLQGRVRAIGTRRWCWKIPGPGV